MKGLLIELNKVKDICIRVTSVRVSLPMIDLGLGIGLQLACITYLGVNHYKFIDSVLFTGVLFPTGENCVSFMNGTS